MQNVVIFKEDGFNNVPSLVKSYFRHTNNKLTVHIVSNMKEYSDILDNLGSLYALVMMHMFEMDDADVDRQQKTYELTLKCLSAEIVPDKIIFICRLPYIPSRHYLSPIKYTRISNISKLIINNTYKSIFQVLLLPIDVYGPGLIVPRSFTMSKICREVLLNDNLYVYTNKEITIRPLFINDMMASIVYALGQKMTGIAEIMPPMCTEEEISNLVIKTLKSSKVIKPIESQRYTRAQQTVGQILKLNLPIVYPKINHSLEEGVLKYLTYIKDYL